MPIKQQCPICIESFGRNRQCVSCNFCQQRACTACVKAYVLSRTADAACMYCRRTWDREFMDANLPKSFMAREYVRHRESVLLDRQMALIPASQEALRGYREVKILKRTLRRLGSERAAANKAYRLANHRLARVRGHDSRTRAQALRARVLRLQKRHGALVRQYRDARERLDTLTRTRYVPIQARAPDQKFVGACPLEGCRGFLTAGGASWVCGTCDARVCPSCREILTAGHACDPGAVATAELLAKDTKPCPKCACPIHKLGGCDQMFCVACKVAFSWRTGEIETGVIHNPHYFEWRREGPAGGEIRCAEDREVDFMDVRRAFPNRAPLESELTHAYQRYVHVRYVMTEAVRNDLPADEDDLDLRLKYLDGELSLDAFKGRIQRRDKLRQKIDAVLRVYATYAASTNDIFLNMINTIADDPGTREHAVKSALRQLRTLGKYANECLDAVEGRFAMRVARIPE